MNMWEQSFLSTLLIWFVLLVVGTPFFLVSDTQMGALLLEGKKKYSKMVICQNIHLFMRNWQTKMSLAIELSI